MPMAKWLSDWMGLVKEKVRPSGDGDVVYFGGSSPGRMKKCGPCDKVIHVNDWNRHRNGKKHKK